MKPKSVVMPALGAAAVLAAACGHDDNTPMTMPPPPPSMSQSLDTAAVLAMAKTTSETADPITVDDGAVVLTDTSETAEPINVDLM
jgi:hypothetical protein